MEVLSQYVVVVVVAICIAVGYIIKHSLDFIPNRYIPLILGILGVIINSWVANWAFTPDIFLGGIASGLASTGVFEMSRNMFDKNYINNVPKESTDVKKDIEDIKEDGDR